MLQQLYLRLGHGGGGNVFPYKMRKAD